MPEYAPEHVRRSMDWLYRADGGRIVATLVRLLGDLDLAEDARFLRKRLQELK